MATRRIPSKYQLETEDRTNPVGFRGSPVVGYIRSPRPGDPGLDKLEAKLQTYSVEHGLNLVEVVRDDGVSGIATWKPGLERIVQGIDCGSYVGLIVPDISHFGRPASAVARTQNRIRQAGGWIQLLE